MQKEKYDYVGHVTYKWDERVLPYLFNNGHNLKFIVSFKGETIMSTNSLSSSEKAFLINSGYSIETKRYEYLTSKSMIKCVPVIVHRIGKTGKPEEILVTVKGRYIQEMMKNTEILINYIKDETGIAGTGDYWGKTEMC